MKHVFNIYPALLIMKPAMRADAIQPLEEVSGKDCRFNENHTQPMLRCYVDMEACLLLELLDEKLIQLKPKKFNGNRYAITYVRVLN
jgi:hypothetical protein